MVKTIMVATVGAWAALIAYNNIVDYGSNWAFVQHVLAMDTVFPDNAVKDRAITNPRVQEMGYWLIIAMEWLIAVLCLWGALQLFLARAELRSFAAAKGTAAIGLLLVWLLYYAGFVIIGGEWFTMWQSAIWNGQQKAVMFVTCSALALIVLMLPEQQEV
jgi:predicted small integral membrane protein